MVNKRGAVILGGLFLFVLAIGLFFIFEGDFGSATVPSSPFCFNKVDMPLYHDPNYPCSGMIEVGNYCCSSFGTVNPDYVCPSNSVSLDGECGNNVQYFRFWDAGGICCSECSSNGCLNNYGSMCYGGFIVDASGEAEVCNNKDDDCDGYIDEGNICDSCTYGGYGLMSYCSYEAMKVIDGENGEDFCSNYNNNPYMCDFYGNYCNYNSGLCTFDMSVCESKTNFRDCITLHPLDGNDFCRWTSDQYTTNYENSRCKDQWNINSLCEWNCYECDINNICCIQKGYDHIIGLLKDSAASCPQSIENGTGCKDGDVWSYTVNSYCDGLTSETCALEQVTWLSEIEACTNGCESGECIVSGDTTAPTISISYPSINNEQIVEPWSSFSAMVKDNVDGTIPCDYYIRYSNGTLMQTYSYEFLNGTSENFSLLSSISATKTDLIFNLTCTDAAGNTASASKTGIDVIADKLGQCDPGCSQNSDCASGLSCETTLGGANRCVPTGSCAQSENNPCYVTDGTIKTVSGCEYICGRDSTGEWVLDKCAETPEAYWVGAFENIISSSSEGDSVQLRLANADASSSSFTIYEEGSSYTTRSASYSSSGDYTYNSWIVPTTGSSTSYSFDIAGYSSGTLSINVVPPECSTDADCPSNQYCSGGDCYNDKTDGGSCTRDSQCISGDCYNGVCVSCGDGTCQSGNGETCGSCYSDCSGSCFCGDGWCTGAEDCSSCESDCGTCPVTKETYWKNNAGTVINSDTITLQQVIDGAKRYKMELVNPSGSPGNFVLKEDSATIMTSSGTSSGSTYYKFWTPTIEQLRDALPGDSDQVYEFYFTVDGETSSQLVLTLQGDLPVCGDGICSLGEDAQNCLEDCFVDPCAEIITCSDYANDEKCGIDQCNVAPADGDNYVSRCSWSGSVCEEVTTITTPEGFAIGTCTKAENSRTNSCENSDFLNVSWNSVWNWDSNNNFPSRGDNPPEGYYFEPADGAWRLTDGSELTCMPGSRVVPCPARVKLSFFNWKNLIIVIIILGLIYLSILEFRKNRNKVVRVEEKEKEQRKEDYKKSKRKAAKKKSVSKKKSVGKRK